MTNNKIDGAALEEVRSKGHITAVVRMAAGAPAVTTDPSMSRADRAQAVHDQKAAAAQAAQADLLALLKSRGVLHKSMWIDNSIIVQQADEALLNELAARDDVGSILGEGSAHIH